MDAILELKKFQRPVIVDFGDEVRLGGSCLRRVGLEDGDRMSIEKIPKDCKASIQKDCCDIEWFPEKVGEMRQVIWLKLDDRFRLQLTLLGTCSHRQEKKKKLEYQKKRALVSIKNTMTLAKSKKIVTEKDGLNDHRLLPWFQAVLRGESGKRRHEEAMSLWQSLASGRTHIRTQVHAGQLRMRSDCRVDVDLGLRATILRLLTDNITTKWLRLAVCIRCASFENHNLKKTLTHILFGHETTFYTDPKRSKRCQERCIREFLALLHFIDEARRRNLFQRRVFNDQTSTAAIVRAFCRETLAKQGDIVPRLARFGIVYSFEQSALDEYDFSIETNQSLTEALRDGIRLARAAELLLDKSLLIYAPTTSRLQKIHNVQEALSAFSVHLPEAAQINLDQLKRDIVDNKRHAGIWLLRQLYTKFAGPIDLNPHVLANQVKRLHEPSAWTHYFSFFHTRDATTLAQAARAAARRFQFAILECFTDIKPEATRTTIDDDKENCAEADTIFKDTFNDNDDKVKTVLRSVTTREWALALAAGCTTDDQAQLRTKYDFVQAAARVYGIVSLEIPNDENDFEAFLNDESGLAEVATRVIEAEAASVIARAMRAKASSLRSAAATIVQALYRRYSLRTILWQNAAAVYIQTNWRLRKRLDPPCVQTTPVRPSPLRVPFSTRRKRRDKRRLSLCLLDAYLLRSARTFSVLLRSLAKRLQVQPSVSCLESLVLADDTSSTLSDFSEDFVEDYFSHENFETNSLDDEPCIIGEDTALAVIQRLVVIWRRHKQVSNTRTHQHHAANVLATAFRSLMLRFHYLKARRGFLALQSIIRGLAERARRGTQFLIVKVQANARRQLAVRAYNKKQVQLLRLQRFIRSSMKHRDDALKHTNAALIQSVCRRSHVLTQYTNLRSSCITLQACVRRLHAFRDYKICLASLSLIQEFIRHRNAVLRDEQRSHQSIIYLQSQWRCCLVLQQVRREKEAVLFLQSVFSRWLSQRKEGAVMKLQSVWRMCIVHSSYRRCLSGIIRVQTLVRARSFAQHTKHALSEDEAAVVLQNRWRRHLALWTFYLRLGAQLKVQKFLRGRWRRLALQINKRRDAPLCAEQPSPQSARKVRGLGTFQRRTRVHLSDARLDRSRAALTRLLRGSNLLVRVLDRRKLRAAIKVQARARALKIRRDFTSPELSAIRDRLHRIPSLPAERIGNRTRAALRVLRTSKSLADMKRAIISLETSTRLSPKCCERFALDRAPLASLFILMRTCNRSKPHLELLACILRVLTNVAVHDALLPRLIAPPNAINVLLELVQVFRDKGQTPFLLAVRLIRRIVIRLPYAHRQAATIDNLKRLASIQTHLKLRKLKVEAAALETLRRTLSPATTPLTPNVSVARG